ncbi:MAG TPA: GNAT family N-acetyltransferase [Usitatibacteraceae bacterium]
MSTPRLETERLILALPAPDQAGQAQVFFERNRGHFAPWRPPEPAGMYTEAYWQAQIPVIADGFALGHSARFWIWEKAAPTRLIGTVGFSQIFRGPFCSCVLGYQIDQECEGQGLMSEALRTAIRYMFSTQKLHRIAANYRPANLRSGRLLARLGFRIEGYAPQYLFIDGAWRDHILTSLVNDTFRPEWLHSI